MAIATCSPARSTTPDFPIILSDAQRTWIKDYIAEPKFKADEDYVGFGSEDVVAGPDAPLNVLAEHVLTDPSLTKDEFLARAAVTVKKFRSADTEDRERAVMSVEKLMLAIGIKSSDGVLSQALYGLDLGPPDEK